MRKLRLSPETAHLCGGANTVAIATECSTVPDLVAQFGRLAPRDDVIGNPISAWVSRFVAPLTNILIPAMDRALPAIEFVTTPAARIFGSAAEPIRIVGPAGSGADRRALLGRLWPARRLRTNLRPYFCRQLSTGATAGGPGQRDKVRLLFEAGTLRSSVIGPVLCRVNTADVGRHEPRAVELGKRPALSTPIARSYLGKMRDGLLTRVPSGTHSRSCFGRELNSEPRRTHLGPGHIRMMTPETQQMLAGAHLRATLLRMLEANAWHLEPFYKVAA